LIEAAGARVKHFPAYSPDFNLIEQCVSKIKEALRAAYVKRSIGLFRVFEQRLLKIRPLRTAIRLPFATSFWCDSSKQSLSLYQLPQGYS
jgi:hypothetical protein